MADFGSPVAQNVDVNPQRQIGTLSALMGLRQQQLGIQQQQQQLSTQTSQATLAQLDAQQTQALSQIDWKPYFDNGDVKGAMNASLAAAPSKPEVATRIAQSIGAGIEVKSAAAKLNQQYLEPFKTEAGVWAQGNGDLPDLAKQYDTLLTAIPKEDQPQVRELSNAILKGLSLPNPITGKPDTKRAALALSQSALGAEVSKPVTGTAIGPGNQLIGTTQMPISGTLARAGGGTTLGLTPAQQPGYLAQAAAASTAGTGATNIDVARASDVGNVQQSSSASIQLTKEVDRLAEDIGSGHVAKMISETGNYFGFSNINQVRSQLNKDLGLLKGTVVSRAGSDARAADILSGYPTDTTPKDTIHAAMDYIRGGFRQNLARGNLLQQYQKQDPQSVRGFAAADNALVNNTNPLMHEYMALKSPQDQAAFFKRNFGNKQEAYQFKAQVDALKKHTNLVQ